MGAFVGLGGGVVIKPLLDLIGKSPIDVVNFISSCAVFAMSISSTAQHIKAKTKINFKLIITISIGAVTGGIFGTKIFELLLNRFDNERLKGIQGLILGVFLVVSVIYINLKNAKSLNIKNPIAVVAVGFALGSIAAFLVFFFSMTMKEAAVYSVGTIFFSQLSKLISTVISGTVPQVDAVMIIAAVVCAVCGGILGAKANKKGNEKTIKTIFTVVVAAIAVVNFYNGVSGLAA